MPGPDGDKTKTKQQQNKKKTKKKEHDFSLRKRSKVWFLLVAGVLCIFYFNFLFLAVADVHFKQNGSDMSVNVWICMHRCGFYLHPLKAQSSGRGIIL